MQSIGEMWARGVNDKTKPKQVEDAIQVQTTPVKPVIDKATESKKAKFRQGILQNATSQRGENK
jgi:hypothetical protein